MPTNVPQFTLNNGTRIPAVGLGCWMGTPGGGQRVYDMVAKAIKIGYRHFDTAAGYANEEQVGKAIRDSGIPRSEFYITTKLANTDHHRVAEAFAESLHKLNDDYLDLYLMHWPQATVEGRPSGDNIGVINDPTVVKVAEKLGVDPAQVLLSWAVHRDIIVVPKTENEARLRTNITLVSLGRDDLAAIDAIHTEPGKHRSLLGYHNTVPGTVFGWTYEEMGWDMTEGGIVASRS
ncbi:hypothetical protein PQX77_006420 [Marasmius sp. AFHP31]|nr:hypothetical protein PQX77_006420 [Marasmius sp. AFHP31]